jgi:hypothetical protein
MALAVAEMERALTVQRRYLFLSPHLDDAILSCGALLTALPARSDVTVVTIFTEASAPPHTRAATSFGAEMEGRARPSWAESSLSWSTAIPPIGSTSGKDGFPGATGCWARR